MVSFTKITGLVLILLGGLGYYLYETFTVLIPIILGTLILILGLIADNPNRKKDGYTHSCHVYSYRIGSMLGWN